MGPYTSTEKGLGFCGIRGVFPTSGETKRTILPKLVVALLLAALTMLAVSSACQAEVTGDETSAFENEFDVEGGFDYLFKVPAGRLKPPCRTASDATSSRVVVVYTHRASDKTPAPTEKIREWVETINWTFRHESSLASEGAIELQVPVDCNAAGEIAVHDVVTTADDFSTVINATKAALGDPEGYGKAVKYLIFARGESSIAGVGGQANSPKSAGAPKSPSNLINTKTGSAVVWQHDWYTQAPLHELLHTMGAVYVGEGSSLPAPPFGLGPHCTDGLDVMCYDQGSGTYTETRCPLSQAWEEERRWRIDCGNDTYFDPIAEPGEWLAEHWNIGEPENAFLIRSAWSTQTTPNPPLRTENSFDAVSCAGTSCIALGPDSNTGNSLVAAKSGAGAWQSLAYQAKGMHDVSCPSSTYCMVVGNEGRAWKLKWEEVNGSFQWKLTDLGLVPIGGVQPKSVDLTGVSCTSESACTAVGSVGYASTSATLAERWNGTSWSRQTTVNPASGDAFYAIGAVSCASSTFCMAVGEADSKPYAERWNGSSWSAIAPAIPSGGLMNDVSCPTTTYCMAVGESSMKTLAESWNGTSWTVLVQPTPPGALWSRLNGVSCVSVSVCQAAGFYWSSETGSLEEKTLGERWNGSTWTIQPTPNVASLFNNFQSVSCTSSTSCNAVGNSRLTSGSGSSMVLEDRLTLAQGWNGSSWAMQETPNAVPRKEHSLTSVSCPTAGVCVAVGNDNYTEKPFIESKNGAGAWQFINTWTAARHMNAISCPSATWCMVVGEEGRAWKLNWEEEGGVFTWRVFTLASVAPAGATSVSLKDVSCTAESSCTAVGSYYLEGWKTLAQRWNGTSWTQQTTPQPATGSAISALQAVSCASGTYCMAVGGAGGKPFAERWNGSAWSISSAVNPSGSTEAALKGVSCPTTAFCMAAGTVRDSSGLAKALTERWNVSPSETWSVLSTPNPTEAKGDARVEDVSCLSAIECVVAGSYASKVEGATVKEERTLAERWNGVSWGIQPTVNPAAFSAFSGISCAPPGAPGPCTAVGASRPNSGGDGTMTLAERWE